MFKRNQLAIELYKKCHLTGDFTLSSGKKSKVYFDKYLMESDPILLQDVCRHMVRKLQIHDCVNENYILAGLATGGIPLATMMSNILNIPTLFVRKESKSYGTVKLAEGIDFKGRQVLVIEDVVTTGTQVTKSILALRKAGAVISNALCVIDREQGGKEKLMKETNVELMNLFTLEEITTAASEAKRYI